MDEIDIDIVANPDLEAPVLIEGLPGVGHVGKLVANHLARAVGGGVVHRDDLQGGPALLAGGREGATERVAPLVVEHGDGDGGAQFGTWPRIHGPSTFAAATGRCFHARTSAA